MADSTDSPTEPKKKRGKKALLIPALVLLLGLGGGGYFVMNSKRTAATEAAAATTSTTEYGKIVRLQPITLNLSDGKVLKVGIALGVVTEPKDEEIALLIKGGEGEKKSEGENPSPLGGHEAKALNETIMTLGDMSFEELSKPGGRAKAKEELAKKIEHAYEGDVVKVYFTEFVMA